MTTWHDSVRPGREDFPWSDRQPDRRYYTPMPSRSEGPGSGRFVAQALRRNRRSSGSRVKLTTTERPDPRPSAWFAGRRDRRTKHAHAPVLSRVHARVLPRVHAWQFIGAPRGPYEPLTDELSTTSMVARTPKPNVSTERRRGGMLSTMGSEQRSDDRRSVPLLAAVTTRVTNKAPAHVVVAAVLFALVVVFSVSKCAGSSPARPPSSQSPHVTRSIP
jgi:hypothetical protein